MFRLAKGLGNLASPVSPWRLSSVRSLTSSSIRVFEPLSKKRNGQSAVSYLHQQLLKKYDPTGKRTALVSGKNAIRAGDIIKVTYLDRSSVLGRVIGVKKGHYNVGSNILIRNKISRVGCEMRIPLYSPEIKNIEILQKPKKPLPRNKQYYIRNSKYDVGDIELALQRQAKAASPSHN